MNEIDYLVNELADLRYELDYLKAWRERLKQDLAKTELGLQLEENNNKILSQEEFIRQCEFELTQVVEENYHAGNGDPHPAIKLVQNDDGFVSVAIAPNLTDWVTTGM